MIAACTSLPVIGVPVQAIHLRGLDSLLSIIAMPMSFIYYEQCWVKGMVGDLIVSC